MFMKNLNMSYSQVMDEVPFIVLQKMLADAPWYDDDEKGGKDEEVLEWDNSNFNKIMSGVTKIQK